jgi:hypothetical protein
MAKREIRTDEHGARDGRAHLLVVGADEFRRAIERIRAEKALRPTRRARQLKDAA